MAKTQKMNLAKTAKMSAAAPEETAAPLLSAPARVTGAADTYEIRPNDMLSAGGESQVYLAAAGTSGAPCVVKIYSAEWAREARAGADRARIVEFLTAHGDHRQFHLMPLLDHGTIVLPDAAGGETTHCVDVLPYCPTGSLGEAGRIPYTTLRSAVIPALLTALQTLHDSGIVHRDVKPANLFFLDHEVVLSDFGTAVVIEADRDAMVKTTLGRGTRGYAPPEISLQYAQKESDYYSLGCTLAALYNGEHFYKALLHQGSEAELNRMMSAKGIQISYEEEATPLKWLIDRLVRGDWTERLGPEGVSLWLKDTEAFHGKYVAPDEKRAGRPAAGQFRKAFCFQDQDYWNKAALAQAMSQAWEEAKEYLYRGGARDSVCAGFFKKDPSLFVEIHRILEDAPTDCDADLGLARFLHFLHEDGDICWRGKRYDSMSRIAARMAEVWRTDGAIDGEIRDLLESEHLSWKLERQRSETGKPKGRRPKKPANAPPIDPAGAADDLARARALEQMAKGYPQLAYFYTMFQFGRDLPVAAQTPDALFASFLESPCVFYTRIEALMREDLTWAGLAHAGHLRAVLELKKRLAAEKRENIENIYTFFENTCEDKTAVRSHYARFGPDSYLRWLSEHLSLYTFHSEEAKALRAVFAKQDFRETSPLAEQRIALLRTKEYLRDFRSLFSGGLLPASLGLPSVRKEIGITSKSVLAFFSDTFYGADTPLGFKRSWGLPWHTGLQNTCFAAEGGRIECS